MIRWHHIKVSITSGMVNTATDVLCKAVDLLQKLGRRLGSGLIDHSQKMTVGARAMAEKKVVGQRS